MTLRGQGDEEAPAAKMEKERASEEKENQGVPWKPMEEEILRRE